MTQTGFLGVCGICQRYIVGAAPAVSGVPTGVIIFAHDVGIRRYAELEHNITRWTDVDDRGGHFAALEEPGIFVDDIRSFLADLR